MKPLILHYYGLPGIPPSRPLHPRAASKPRRRALSVLIRAFRAIMPACLLPSAFLPR